MKTMVGMRAPFGSRDDIVVSAPPPRLPFFDVIPTA
jgi:hypothetical protein